MIIDELWVKMAARTVHSHCMISGAIKTRIHRRKYESTYTSLQSMVVAISAVERTVAAPPASTAAVFQSASRSSVEASASTPIFDDGIACVMYKLVSNNCECQLNDHLHHIMATYPRLDPVWHSSGPRLAEGWSKVIRSTRIGSIA